jgi:hypothetical protein
MRMLKSTMMNSMAERAMLLVVPLHPKDMFTLVSWSLFALVPHRNTLQGHSQWENRLIEL